MQHLDTLWKLVNAAGSVREMAIQRKTFAFAVHPPITFFLHAETASVEVARWNKPLVEIDCELQASFGWKLHAEQDEAGVYVVARRRPVLGELARAHFKVRAPRDTYLVLRLGDGRVVLDDVRGTLRIDPPEAGGV